MIKKIIICLFIMGIVGCDKPSATIDDCVSIYYVELNGGTNSVIIKEGNYGARQQTLFGKYIRNDDGTITLTSGGNVRRQSGFRWHTVKVDPDMLQLSIYMHPDCVLCEGLKIEWSK